MTLSVRRTHTAASLRGAGAARRCEAGTASRMPWERTGEAPVFSVRPGRAEDHRVVANALCVRRACASLTGLQLEVVLACQARGQVDAHGLERLLDEVAFGGAHVHAP